MDDKKFNMYLNLLTPAQRRQFHELIKCASTAVKLNPDIVPDVKQTFQEKFPQFLEFFPQ